jgi:ABC-type multidrug transport system fused ATPase/permease subunit
MKKGIRPRAFQSFASLLPSQILEVVGFATIGAIVIIMLMSHLSMEEIISTASILMLTAWRILPAVNRSLAYSVMIRALKPDAMPSLDLLESFKKAEPDPRPDPDPSFSFSKSLKLEKASFHYPESKKTVLSEACLEIKKGESVGLIGPSGSGKSTLALLLSALAPPTQGEYRVDGAPLTPAKREAFFKVLGYVPQNPLILDGTLADNIAFCDWGGAYDADKLKTVLKKAAIDFVDFNCEGLDMKLSSSNQELSGGQVQMVAIARALYNSPEILIFDEATSALDQTSENIVKRTLSESKGSITSIIIAHRLSTVSGCDTVYWIEDGKIKDSGPPDRILPLYEEDSLRREALRIKEEEKEKNEEGKNKDGDEEKGKAREEEDKG